MMAQEQWNADSIGKTIRANPFWPLEDLAEGVYLMVQVLFNLEDEFLRHLNTPKS